LKDNISSTSCTKLGYDVPVYDMPHLFDQTSRYQSSEQVINLRNGLGSCLNILNDKTSLQVLQSLLEKLNSREEIKLEPKIVNRVLNKTRTNREFRLNENIGDFNMGDIILYLGSEVNVLPKMAWEAVGEHKLGYSPI
jgi:hypothetical protein